MSLKSTVEEMRQLLHAVLDDLAKAAQGNRAASQRVRVTTIDLEKTAKKYRKESVTSEHLLKSKNGKTKAKAPAKTASKAAPKAKLPVQRKKVLTSHMNSAAKKPTAKFPSKR